MRKNKMKMKKYKTKRQLSKQKSRKKRSKALSKVLGGSWKEKAQSTNWRDSTSRRKRRTLRILRSWKRYARQNLPLGRGLSSSCRPALL